MTKERVFDIIAILTLVSLAQCQLQQSNHRQHRYHRDNDQVRSRGFGRRSDRGVQRDDRQFNLLLESSGGDLLRPPVHFPIHVPEVPALPPPLPPPDHFPVPLVVHRIAGEAPPDDWEVGLKEAVYRALTRDRVSNPDLKKELSNAPIFGKNKNGVSRFGDIAMLARGQLYDMRQGGYEFVQDPDPHVCDEDCRYPHCDRKECRIKHERDLSELVALWSVKRVRHRDSYFGHRYELHYTISPKKDARTDLVTRDGYFDYTVPGHLFIVKTTTVPFVTDAATSPRPPVDGPPLPQKHEDYLPPPPLSVQRQPHSVWVHRNIRYDPNIQRDGPGGGEPNTAPEYYDNDHQDDRKGAAAPGVIVKIDQDGNPYAVQALPSAQFDEDDRDVPPSLQQLVPPPVHPDGHKKINGNAHHHYFIPPVNTVGGSTHQVSPTVPSPTSATRKTTEKDAPHRFVIIPTAFNDPYEDIEDVELFPTEATTVKAPTTSTKEEKRPLTSPQSITERHTVQSDRAIITTQQTILHQQQQEIVKGPPQNAHRLGSSTNQQDEVIVSVTQRPSTQRSDQGQNYQPINQQPAVTTQPSYRPTAEFNRQPAANSAQPVYQQTRPSVFTQQQPVDQRNQFVYQSTTDRSTAVKPTRPAYQQTSSTTAQTQPDRQKQLTYQSASDQITSLGPASGQQNNFVYQSSTSVSPAQPTYQSTRPAITQKQPTYQVTNQRKQFTISDQSTPVNLPQPAYQRVSSTNPPRPTYQQTPSTIKQQQPIHQTTTQREEFIYQSASARPTPVNPTRPSYQQISSTNPSKPAYQQTPSTVTQQQPVHQIANQFTYQPTSDQSTPVTYPISQSSAPTKTPSYRPVTYQLSGVSPETKNMSSTTTPEIEIEELFPTKKPTTKKLMLGVQPTKKSDPRVSSAQTFGPSFTSPSNEFDELFSQFSRPTGQPAGPIFTSRPTGPTVGSIFTSRTTIPQNSPIFQYPTQSTNLGSNFPTTLQYFHNGDFASLFSEGPTKTIPPSQPVQITSVPSTNASPEFSHTFPPTNASPEFSNTFPPTNASPEFSNTFPPTNASPEFSHTFPPTSTQPLSPGLNQFFSSLSPQVDRTVASLFPGGPSSVPSPSVSPNKYRFTGTEITTNHNQHFSTDGVFTDTPTPHALNPNTQTFGYTTQGLTPTLHYDPRTQTNLPFSYSPTTFRYPSSAPTIQPNRFSSRKPADSGFKIYELLPSPTPTTATDFKPSPIFIQYSEADPLYSNGGASPSPKQNGDPISIITDTTSTEDNASTVFSPPSQLFSSSQKNTSKEAEKTADETPKISGEAKNADKEKTPDSINAQLPPPAEETDTTVPYVAATMSSHVSLAQFSPTKKYHKYIPPYHPKFTVSKFKPTQTTTQVTRNGHQKPQIDRAGSKISSNINDDSADYELFDQTPSNDYHFESTKISTTSTPSTQSYQSPTSTKTTESYEESTVPEEQDPDNPYETLTSQSYKTSISFVVNKRNKTKSKTKPTETSTVPIIKIKHDKPIKAMIEKVNVKSEYDVYKAKIPTKSTQGDGDDIDVFGDIAMSLVNHAREMADASKQKKISDKSTDDDDDKDDIDIFS